MRITKTALASPRSRPKQGVLDKDQKQYYFFDARTRQRTIMYD